MSRGFVKEEDQEEAPFIPPRAALPPGAINYVTPQGMELLLMEKEQLEQERLDNIQENETERRRTNMLIDGKLNLLNARISSARILDPKEQPQDEARFGATVHLRPTEIKDKKQELTFTIVGVDEASVKEGKIAFVAPIAQAVTGKKEGDMVSLRLGNRVQEFTLVSIHYAVQKP